MGGPDLRLWCCSGMDGIVWGADRNHSDRAVVRVMTLDNRTYVEGPWSWAANPHHVQSAPRGARV